MLATVALAENQVRYNYAPTTISPAAQKEWTAIYAAKDYARAFPAANDLGGRRKTLARQGKVEVSSELPRLAHHSDTKWTDNAA